MCRRFKVMGYDRQSPSVLTDTQQAAIVVSEGPLNVVWLLFRANEMASTLITIKTEPTIFFIASPLDDKSFLGYPR